MLDREIKSWPSIDWEQYPGGISGSNGAQITGIGDVQEAKNLALVLQTGALPVEFVTLDQTAISATLGKDSLDEAKTAAIVGLLLVALFLLVFYRFLGLIAVLGLGIYAAFLYAAILLFNVTLTLPGFAGLVLTLGVAADANVVIFERIKEEARAGRSVKAAIQTGYTKGFATIVDANVVTAITALVLFAVATSSVRGFALMLLIGTAISMLTAVLATRAFLSLLAGSKFLENPKVIGTSGGGIPSWLKIDFIGRRRLWFGISATVVTVSVLALAILQLNLGIDFKGGTQIAFTTPAPTSLETVREQAARVGQSNAVIQGRGPSTNGDYKSFQIRTETLTTDEAAQLHGEPEEDGRRGRVRGQERVGELRPPDREERDPRDLRLAAPDRRLHLDAVPVAVRRARDRGADPRHPDHDRDLRPARAGGDDRHGRRGADRARVLDLRHDHHLRPDQGEHPADEARLVPADHERVAVGDDPAVARDHVHHPAADRLAPDLRRRDAQRLRVRPAHRHRLRRVLVDLRRGAAARLDQGARARVRAPQARGGGRGAVGRRHRPPRRARVDARRRGRASSSRPSRLPHPPAPAPASSAGRDRRRARRSSRPHGRAR